MENAFRFFKFSAPARLILAGFFFAACVFVQIQLDFVVIGMILAVPSWFILKTKAIDNRPKDLGLEEWRPVSEAEITRVADFLKESKKLQKQLAGPDGLKLFLIIGMGVLGVILAGNEAPAAIVFFDAALFLIPGLFFGGVRMFIPETFNLKLSGFLAVMNDFRVSTGMVLTPYLRFDQDKDKKEIPEDIRLMLEPKRKPADLVGIQFQMSINNGQHGRVPYLYAVVLTRGKSGSAYAHFSRLRADKFKVEPGGDENYGTVVVRQKTEGGGYHTRDADCVRLFNVIAEHLKKLTPEE